MVHTSAHLMSQQHRLRVHWMRRGNVNCMILRKHFWRASIYNILYVFDFWIWQPNAQFEFGNFPSMIKIVYRDNNEKSSEEPQGPNCLSRHVLVSILKTAAALFGAPDLTDVYVLAVRGKYLSWSCFPVTIKSTVFSHIFCPGWEQVQTWAPPNMTFLKMTKCGTTFRRSQLRFAALLVFWQVWIHWSL